MAAIPKIASTNRASVPGEGPLANIFVKAGEYNKLVDRLNSITTEDGDLNINGDLTVGDDLAITGDLTVTGTTTLNGTLVLGDAAADALTVNATTTYGEPINYDNATGISAFATGGQASATALTAELNNVTTVATAGDSVKLPAAAAGKHVWVKNSGAAALDIFPATSDSIDALAVNLAIRIQPGSSISFYAKDAIVWESSLDNSITLNSPTTVTGQLEIKATASAGNTVTTITNASQAAARTYTVPDAGGSASFVMTEGAQTINGAKTLGGVLTTVGIVQAPVFVADATPYTVLAADSGKMHIILEQTNTITLNLPVIAAGLSYKFIMGGVATEAQNWVITATTPSFYNGGIAWTDLDDTESNLAVVYANGTSHLTLTVTTPAAGTGIEIYSNGTEWFAHGTVISDSTPAFT